MNNVFTTFAVAEDSYRRNRASHDIKLAGHGHHTRRVAGWRDRRRTTRPGVAGA